MATPTKGTVPPLMSHAERRKLIEAPIVFNIYGTHYGHAGISFETFHPGERGNLKFTLDVGNYEI